MKRRIIPEMYSIDQLTGCWNWLRSKTRQGYGNMTSGKTRGAHRISFQDYKGQIPTGLLVMHSCDNPSCVNPDHLGLGTIADNNRDRDRKGRAARRENKPNWKISDATVIQAHRIYSSGSRSIRSIAKECGVSHVCLLRRFKSPEVSAVINKPQGDRL